MGRIRLQFSLSGVLASRQNDDTAIQDVLYAPVSRPANSGSASGTGCASTEPELASSVSSSTPSPLSLSPSSSSSSGFPSPTSTAPTSTAAGDPLVRFNKLYVHWEARPSQHQRDGFEKSLRPWLDQEIAQHTYGQKYGIELLSAGFRAGGLRPAIVISCPEAQTKKSIQSLLKRDKWLKRELLHYQLDIHVVYCDIGLATGPQSDFPVQPECPQDPYFELGSDTSTLCGQRVHIGGSDGQPAKCFTFTATLLVGTELRGLYPAHPLLGSDHDKKLEPEPRTTSPSYSEDDDMLEPFSLLYDSDGSTISSTPSPQSFLESDYQLEPLSLLYDYEEEDGATCTAAMSHSCRRILFDESLKSTKPIEKQETSRSQHEKRHVKVAELRVSGSKAKASDPRLDYTFADLVNSIAEWGHDVVAENRVDGEILTEFHQEKPDCSTAVAVASPQATVHGHLRPSSVIFHAGGVSYNLRLVTLEHPLQRGSSGSPVACGNKLCGFIAVVREDVPWAYMIPIDAVVADIEAVHEVKVSLPAEPRQHIHSETGQRDFVRDQPEHICMGAKSKKSLHEVDPITEQHTQITEHRDTNTTPTPIPNQSQIPYTSSHSSTITPGPQVFGNDQTRTVKKTRTVAGPDLHSGQLGDFPSKRAQPIPQDVRGNQQDLLGYMGSHLAVHPRPNSEWELYRPLFTRLYMEENRRLPEVIQILKDKHGFWASEKMFKNKIKSWGLRKYLKVDEVKKIFDGEVTTVNRLFLPGGDPDDIRERAQRTLLRKRARTRLSPSPIPLSPSPIPLSPSPIPLSPTPIPLSPSFTNNLIVPCTRPRPSVVLPLSENSNTTDFAERFLLDLRRWTHSAFIHGSWDSALSAQYDRGRQAPRSLSSTLTACLNLFENGQHDLAFKERNKALAGLKNLDLFKTWYGERPLSLLHEGERVAYSDHGQIATPILRNLEDWAHKHLDPQEGRHAPFSDLGDLNFEVPLNRARLNRERLNRERDLLWFGPMADLSEWLHSIDVVDETMGPNSALNDYFLLLQSYRKVAQGQHKEAEELYDQGQTRLTELQKFEGNIDEAPKPANKRQRRPPSCTASPCPQRRGSWS